MLWVFINSKRNNLMLLGITFLEWSANIMTALCIFLAGRNNVFTWPIGIIATLLFGLLFFEAKLYADVTLQLFFVITGCIGWIGWKKNKFDVSKIPQKATKQTLINFFIIAIVLALSYGWLLHNFTDAYLPYIDSLVLTFSIVGQLLLMRKKLETWLFWIFVNTLSVPLYISRDLYLTSFMYGLFFINAIFSYFYWKKLMKDTNV